MITGLMQQCGATSVVGYGYEASDNGNSDGCVLCTGLELTSGVAWLRNGRQASDYGNSNERVLCMDRKLTSGVAWLRNGC